MEAELTEQARDECAEAWQWLHRANPHTAERFEARLAIAIDQLREFTRSGAPLGGGVRKMSLAPYPFSLVYTVDGNRIIVIAIVHLSSTSLLLR